MWQITMLKDDELGVFFICFKEKTAIEKSIDSFRKLYPNSPIYLSSDGGFDYSYLNDEITNCVLDKEQTVGITKDIENMIQTGQFPILNLFMAATQYLQRLEKAVRYCNTRYILLMEPDVFVRGKLNLLDIPLVGPKPNQMPDIVRRYILNCGGKDNVAWGAAAGVMQSEAFLKIFNDLKNNQYKILEWLLIDPRIACYDYLLTFIFSVYGFDYEENPDLIECNRNPNWGNTHHPLIHQYYENYISQNGETGKHHEKTT